MSIIVVEKNEEGRLTCPVEHSQTALGWYKASLVDLRWEVNSLLAGKNSPPCFFMHTARSINNEIIMQDLASALMSWPEQMAIFLASLRDEEKALLKKSTLIWITAALWYIIGLNWHAKVKNCVQEILNEIWPKRVITGDTYKQISGEESLLAKVPTLTLGEVPEKIFLKVYSAFWRFWKKDITVEQIIVWGINTALSEFGWLMMATTVAHQDNFGFEKRNEIIRTLRASIPLLQQQSMMPMELTIRHPHLSWWNKNESGKMEMNPRAREKMRNDLLERWENDPSSLYQLGCPIWYSNIPVFRELFEMLMRHVELNFWIKSSCRVQQQ